MLDFIVVPVVVGMITLGIYKFFELLVCRRERLNIIEKLDSEALSDYLKNVPMGLRIGRASETDASHGISFVALRLGCLLLGLGGGLLFGYWYVGDCAGNYYAQGAVYGGSVLGFGGLGLVVAFVVERLICRKKQA